MKAQILSNFLIECIILDQELITSDQFKEEVKYFYQILHVDGVSHSYRSRVGFILASLDWVITEDTLKFDFNTSNNAIKYEVLVASLKIAKELQVQELKVFFDSQLIVK